MYKIISLTSLTNLISKLAGNQARKQASNQASKQAIHIFQHKVLQSSIFKYTTIQHNAIHM